MGGMGRAFDGGYAEYALLPTERLMPLETHLDWEVLGALPETFLTARGSLDVLGPATRASRCSCAAPARRSAWPPSGSAPPPACT